MVLVFGLVWFDGDDQIPEIEVEETEVNGPNMADIPELSSSEKTSLLLMMRTVIVLPNLMCI